MNIMIAGGSGFLGNALTKSFLADGHKVFILTRGASVPTGAQAVKWDAKTTNGWGHLVNEMDVIIHLAGRSLASWPWTAATKRDFHDSRIFPGLALGQAILEADHRPGIFIQHRVLIITACVVTLLTSPRRPEMISSRSSLCNGKTQQNLSKN